MYFAPARDSVSWAEQAITEFRNSTAGFFQSDITEIVTEIDPKTGENVQKVRLIKDLPTALRRKATEALVNTRHAFDQATFAARNITSGISNKTIYFPWAQSPTDLERLLKARGIDQRIWSTFSAQEPYPTSNAYAGGNDTIRSLAKMANDKHTVGLSVAANISGTSFPTISGGYVDHLNILNPAWDAVKNEAELIRWIGDANMNGNYKFAFEVLFQDSRLAQPVNAPSGLGRFAAKAKAFIECIQARCVELRS